MPVITVEEVEAKIVDYWARRSSLDTAEWEEFAKLIFGYLGKKNYSHYTTLQRSFSGEGHETLKRQFVEDFFTDKIFLPAIAENFQASKLDSARVLSGSYYPNYLIEKTRKFERYGKLVDDVGRESPTEGCTGCGEIQETDYPGSNDGKDLDTNDVSEGSFDDAPLPAGDELINSEDIQASAVTFLGARERCDWVIRFLGCHQCVDEEDRPALQWLAKKHGITSYARKAKELGITRPHGGYTRAAPWAATMLGTWLKGVGIDVDVITGSDQSRTHRGDGQIAVALKILCRESLNKAATEKCC